MKETLHELIILACVAGGLTLLNTLFTWFLSWRFGKLKHQINSRMDDLLEAARAAGHREGMAEQRVEDSRIEDKIEKKINQDKNK